MMFSASSSRNLSSSSLPKTSSKWLMTSSTLMSTLLSVRSGTRITSLLCVMMAMCMMPAVAYAAAGAGALEDNVAQVITVKMMTQMYK